MTVAFAAVLFYYGLMSNKTNRRIKNISLILLGFVLGALFCYGFMWWQVYRKFDTVWTCQVFTGALSIEEQKTCQDYRWQRDNGKLRYY